MFEAKIGNADIDHDQVRAYAALAKSHEIDAVITISNQFVALPTHSFVSVGKVLERYVTLYHWSWTFIITEAMLLINDNEFTAPEQKFILSELVRFLSHDSTGVRRFDRMNKDWKDVVVGVNARRTLSKSAPEVMNSIAAWHQEARDLSLLMRRKLGSRVRQKLIRAHVKDPGARVAADAERLANQQVRRRNRGRVSEKSRRPQMKPLRQH